MSSTSSSSSANASFALSVDWLLKTQPGWGTFGRVPITEEENFSSSSSSSSNASSSSQAQQKSVDWLQKAKSECNDYDELYPEACAAVEMAKRILGKIEMQEDKAKYRAIKQLHELQSYDNRITYRVKQPLTSLLFNYFCNSEENRTLTACYESFCQGAKEGLGKITYFMNWPKQMEIPSLRALLPRSQVTSLNLFQNDIKATEAQSLIQILPETRITRISFKENYTFGGVPNLARVLSQTQITSLNLERTGTIDADIQSLAEVLAKTPITTLYLGWNSIGPDGAHSLAQVLAQTHVTYLNLVGNPIREAGATDLIEAIALIRSKEGIINVVGAEGITQEKIEHVMQVKFDHNLKFWQEKTHQRIEDRQRKEASLKEAEARKHFEELNRKIQLITSNIQTNTITHIDLANLSIPINLTRTTKISDIRLNPIVAQDVKGLLQALRSNTSVISLNLRYNRELKDDVIDLLIEIHASKLFSRGNKTLISIDLRGTSVTSQGVARLENALQKLKFKVTLWNDFQRTQSESQGPTPLVLTSKEAELKEKSEKQAQEKEQSAKNEKAQDEKERIARMAKEKRMNEAVQEKLHLYGSKSGQQEQNQTTQDASEERTKPLNEQAEDRPLTFALNNTITNFYDGDRASTASSSSITTSSDVKEKGATQPNTMAKQPVTPLTNEQTKKQEEEVLVRKKTIEQEQQAKVGNGQSEKQPTVVERLQHLPREKPMDEQALAEKEKELKLLLKRLPSLEANARQVLQINAQTLQQVVTKQQELQRKETEIQLIQSHDALKDYYYTFLILFTDALTACKSIHAKVGPARAAQSQSDLDNVVMSCVEAIGRDIPVVGLLTNVLAGAHSLLSKRNKMQKINQIAIFLPTITEGDIWAETLARRLTLAQESKLRAVPSQQTGFIQRALNAGRSVKCWLTADDRDNEIRRLASEQCETLITHIINDKFHCPAKLGDISSVVVTLLGQSETPMAASPSASSPMVHPSSASATTSFSYSASTAMTLQTFSGQSTTLSLSATPSLSSLSSSALGATSITYSASAAMTLQTTSTSLQPSIDVREFREMQELVRQMKERAEKAESELKATRQKAEKAERDARATKKAVEDSGISVGDNSAQLFASANAHPNPDLQALASSQAISDSELLHRMHAALVANQLMDGRDVTANNAVRNELFGKKAQPSDIS